MDILEIIDAKDLAIEQLLFRLKRHIEGGEKVITVQKGQKLTDKGVVADRKEQIHKNDTGKVYDSGRQAKLIKDLTDTISVLEQRLTKMEQIIKAKDEKIRQLSESLE